MLFLFGKEKVTSENAQNYMYLNYKKATEMFI